MLSAAVKFGRMSKKQRERVENEANFHKRRLSQQSPGNGCYDNVDKQVRTSDNNNSDHGDRLKRY